MIDAEKANYTITRMCRLLQVDRRRYHEWAKRRAAGPTPAEQRRAEKEGDELDLALWRLDQFKTVQSQLSSTAMH